VEGIGEPVNMNKVVPVRDEPQVGEMLYGTVELMTSKKGTSYYKFKAEKEPDDAQPVKSPAQSSYVPQESKDESIARAVALKAAVERHAYGGEVFDNQILDTADTFLAWLQNSGSAGSREVSTSTPPQQTQATQNPVSAVGQTGYDKARQQANTLRKDPPADQDPELQSLMDAGDYGEDYEQYPD
jgi:hypothetical protein